ncbi:MAG: hypothetical protein ACE5JR_07070 [Gemmatimonadota bacterium]
MKNIDSDRAPEAGRRIRPPPRYVLGLWRGALFFFLIAFAAEARAIEAEAADLLELQDNGPDGMTDGWRSPFGEERSTSVAVPMVVGELFIISAPVSSILHELWLESVEVQQERVACLGGYFDERDNAVHITRVDRVPARADSLRSEAGPSLARCGTPMWSGTVHTHIALYRGYPYATFSVNDRAVMALWRSRWKAEGLFCVLYSETLAYCEWGPALSADVAYNETPAMVVSAGE